LRWRKKEKGRPPTLEQAVQQADTEEKREKEEAALSSDSRQRKGPCILTLGVEEGKRKTKGREGKGLKPNFPEPEQALGRERRND